MSYFVRFHIFELADRFLLMYITQNHSDHAKIPARLCW